MSTNIFMTSGPNSWKCFLLFIYSKIAELSLWSQETNNGILADNTHHKWKREAFVLKIVQYKEFSLVVQWLRLHVSTVGGSGSIPDWGTKISHVTPLGQKKKKKKSEVCFLIFLGREITVSEKTSFSYEEEASKHRSQIFLSLLIKFIYNITLCLSPFPLAKKTPDFSS